MENRSQSATVHPHPPPPNSTPTAQNRRLKALTNGNTFIIILLVLVPVALILYSTYRPSPPDFRVDSLSLSNLNLSSSSSSSITANWAADFTVLNSNKKTTLHFDQLKAAVYHGDALLSVTAVQPFLVPPAGNRTAIRATFAAVGAYVDEKVAEGINGSRVVFDVRALARVRLSGRWWWWPDYWTVTVYCGDLAVGMYSSTSSGGPPRECSVSASSGGGRPRDQCLVW